MSSAKEFGQRANGPQAHPGDAHRAPQAPRQTYPEHDYDLSLPGGSGTYGQPQAGAPRQPTMPQPPMQHAPIGHADQHAQGHSGGYGAGQNPGQGFPGHMQGQRAAHEGYSSPGHFPGFDLARGEPSSHASAHWPEEPHAAHHGHPGEALRGSFAPSAGASANAVSQGRRPTMSSGAAPQGQGHGQGSTDPYAPQFTEFARSSPANAPANQGNGYRLGQHHGEPEAYAAGHDPYGSPGHGYPGFESDPAASYVPPSQGASAQSQGGPSNGGQSLGSKPQASANAYADPAFGGTWPGQDYADGGPQHQGDPSNQGYDEAAYAQGHAGTSGYGEFGFAEAAGGELDPNYVEDDYEYEDEPAPRRGGFAKIAAALVGAVVIGGGLAYGYRTVVGDSGSNEPPLVRSASAPEKVKPIEAGGKKFDHSDSKLMTRLGESSAAGGAAAGTSRSASASEFDNNGTRKVSTLVVGRDGSIQPSAPGKETVAIPGLTVVDALGGGSGANAAPSAPSTPPAAAAPATPQAPKLVNAEPSKTVVEPPKQRPPSTTASLSESAAPAATKPVTKKVAAVDPTPAPKPTPSPAPAPKKATSGYVAVLASLPQSSTSRMAALARFADMQQKYASVLNGKTPDVAAANLGAKGNYHRLVVGPPASRQQASAVCSALKAEGYSECWITAY